MSEMRYCKTRRCCVGNCTSVGSCRTFNTETGLILFRFPSASRPCTNLESRQKWIDFVKEKRPDYKPHGDSYVCSDHFTFDCLALGSVLKMQFGMKTKPCLKREAFPTMQKESVETNTEPDKDCMDESTALTTNTRSRAKMLKKKNTSKSFSLKSSFQTGKAKAAKTKSKASLVSKDSFMSKSAKMTSLKSKCTTPVTTKSKRKTSSPEENNIKSGKRLRKTQAKNRSKKRKLSEKPEIVVERWGEDDEEDGPKDGEGGSPDKGESPTDKEGGPPDPKVSKSDKEIRNAAPSVSKKTELGPEGDFLKEFFKTQVDSTKTKNFINFQNKSNFLSSYPAQTKAKESDTLKVNANPRMPHKSSCKVSEGKTKGPKIAGNSKGPERNTGTTFDSTVATTSKISYPEKASNTFNVNLEKDMSYSEANDNYLVFERPIKQETEVSGSLNMEPLRKVLRKESNSSNSNGDKLLELSKNRSEMESIDLQVQNTSLHQDGEESALPDQDLRHPGDASEGPGEMFFDINDNSADSDVALAVDEEENTIFCCSTCGDVQSVEGESRVVICNDMTMKMTNTLSSEFMSVFCKKCSTESETCFQCNEHIERGKFKEHLKLHFE